MNGEEKVFPASEPFPGEEEFTQDIVALAMSVPEERREEAMTLFTLLVNIERWEHAKRQREEAEDNFVKLLTKYEILSETEAALVARLFRRRK